MAFTFASPPEGLGGGFGGLHSWLQANDPDRYAAMQDWFAGREALSQASGGHLYGGGPGDVGYGPGVMPPSWVAGGGPTAAQIAQIQAVANNPNLLHGPQGSRLPLWQVNGEYPGGVGWNPGVTPLPPGDWSGYDQTTPGVFAGNGPGGGAGNGPRFLGPPVHNGGEGGGPRYLGPPIHPGEGGQGGGPKVDRSEARLGGMNWAARQHQNTLRSLVGLLGGGLGSASY